MPIWITLWSCVMLPCMFFVLLAFSDSMIFLKFEHAISFHQGFMVIQMHKSKNGQLRRGNEIVISELPSSACPVSLLKRYLDKFLITPNSRDLISKPISKGKGFCKLVSPDKPISYSCIRDGFRRVLKKVGVDPSKFGLHSLRSGGAWGLFGG